MNERVELRIDGLSHDGQGVGRLDGQACFVPGALPGERVAVRLHSRAHRLRLAVLERVLEPSADRRRPPCILADHCGGCSLQHLDDPAQADWKRSRLVETLRRLAHLDPIVAPTLASPQPLGYRNRAIIPLERLPEGPLRAGYYRRGSHRIVNMNRCPVLDPRLDALIAPLKADLEISGWPVDRDLRDGGGLRHLSLRVGHHTGEVLLTLISSHDEFPDLADWAQRWLDRWPTLVGVTLNLQPRPTNTLMGPQTTLVAGRSWLMERFSGLDLRIATDTFFQVHTTQAERVVTLLLAALAAETPGVLVDAYCGIGTFSLPLAAAGWTVHGIERNAEAIRLARINAEINTLTDRARFETANVAEILEARLTGCDALLVDPPRKGLDPTVLRLIRQCPPASLLYLSCDPATLARDLGQLVEGGLYAIASVQPLDFFPQTSHIETLAVLRRTG
ncbi:MULTISPECIES: 23S rRNA (uracil(1939)-C(5))-methyltransferase RlmD [Aphanothece]|uniref:23S rRNA (uracil(1939)-C(5))-methyltransferase RlmD n=1 Tax=Aphanothece TaxID=1121 RepID=UPI003984E0D6